jgi:hypothetical protein
MCTNLVVTQGGQGEEATQAGAGGGRLGVELLLGTLGATVAHHANGELRGDGWGRGRGVEGVGVR